MTDETIRPFSAEYGDYLSDESRRVGSADSISFPTSEAEVVAILRRGVEGGVTIQGARTGITGGSVPEGGHVMNLSRMAAIGEPQPVGDGEYSLLVQPGATLNDVRTAIEPMGVFFPPDPTETTATIGGMVACNASGAMSFHYGPTRRWIRALRVALADGSVLALSRGSATANGREFSLTTTDGRTISGRLPAYTPPPVKSAAGYYVADGMDLIDLFIGMEGTLGVVTEAELRLIPRPGAIAGLTVFLPSEEAAISAVRALRGEGTAGLDVGPVAVEFFNSDVLNLLRNARAQGGAFAAIPVLRPEFHTAVYVEFHGADEDEVESAVMEAIEGLAKFGASEDDTWYASSEREMAPLKAFRHAAPEAVNMLIGERKKAHPGLTKLGTDMSVPAVSLDSVMSMYSRELGEAGLESVIFGHIGDNHVHVNILPRDMGEYDTGKALYRSWAERVVAMGGSVSAEHGIGKIKASFLELMYGEAGIAEMRALRSIFDPQGILNPGDLFR